MSLTKKMTYTFLSQEYGFLPMKIVKATEWDTAFTSVSYLQDMLKVLEKCKFSQILSIT